MAIHRIKKEKDFTVLDNEMLRNPNLSLKAKGLQSYMLSRPPDWVFTVQGLSKFCRDGPDSVRAALQELEKAGYVVRKRKRINGKYQEMNYDIYERPVQVFPTQAPPEKGKPKKEKTAVPNTDELSTDILIMDDHNDPSVNHQKMERQIRDQIEYDIMCQRYDPGQLDDLIAVMVETMACTAETICVSRDKVYPADYVRSCIAKISPLHIEQIMESLMTNRPAIRNVRGYLLASLINAANTLDMGYQYGVEYSL